MDMVAQLSAIKNGGVSLEECENQLGHAGEELKSPLLLLLLLRI
jgi:hypothetical protein